jgi:hypothetical protein
MIEPHWHKWLSGDEWAKMGPFPDEQACPYCRTEKAEARVRELEGEVERCAGELDYEARHLRGVLSGEER